MTLIKVNTRGTIVEGGRRRLNPNGAMLVAQRATTKATLTNGYNCLDRVFTYKSHDGVVEESQSTDTPNSEFYNSLKHRVTTADTSITASQYHALSFRLEGNSVTQLGFGTSGAKKVTVSFWVKSSVAGAYGTCLRNLASNRFNMQTMTINSADTWEKKSITYTGDTSGTWPKDNTEGLQLQISQAMGSNYFGTSADTWVTNIDVSPSNQVNWLATVGNTFYITGLQIEEGDTATEFEHRSYGEELQLCRRYFENSNQAGIAYLNHVVYTTSASYCTYFYDVEKRVAPSISHGSAVWRIYQNGVLIANANGQGGSDGIGTRNFALTLSGPTFSNNSGGMADYRADNGILIDAEL